MIKAPQLPARLVDVPVTPHEAQQAGQGVQNNGRRLQLTLTGLIVYNALSVVLGFILPFWIFNSLPELIASMDAPVSAADTEEFKRSIPTWLAPLLGALYALIPAVNVWLLNVLRQAVKAVQGWTLAPQDGAQDVTRRLLSVRPWLTLGQWLPVILGVIMLVFVVFMFVALGSDVGSSASDAGLGLLVAVPVYLLPLAGWAVVSWLFLAAVKRWLDAVVTRTTQPSFPVRPFARSLDGWLIFLLVLLGLGLLNSLASLAMMLFFPSFMTAVMGSEPTSQADAQIMEQMAKWMQNFAWLGLLGMVSYVLLGLATFWTRSFTNDVSTVLDARRPEQPQPASVVPAVPDNW